MRYDRCTDQRSYKKRGRFFFYSFTFGSSESYIFHAGCCISYNCGGNYLLKSPGQWCIIYTERKTNQGGHHNDLSTYFYHSRIDLRCKLYICYTHDSYKHCKVKKLPAHSRNNRPHKPGGGFLCSDGVDRRRSGRNRLNKKQIQKNISFY